MKYFSICIALLILLFLLYYQTNPGMSQHKKNTAAINSHSPTNNPLFKKINKVVIQHDQDKDKILDLEDILQGAKKTTKKKIKYISTYHRGGYPPGNEGVCTDVIWRALKHAGYNLKKMVDKDIRKRIRHYPRVNGRPDPNIDFRRVANLQVFFKKHAKNLTLKLKPNNANNLSQWQGGDIATFADPDHIVIISDKRRKNGVPYIIHHIWDWTYPVEVDELLAWMPNITGHFRFPNK